MKGACWMVIDEGRCEDEISMETTRAECCGTVGKAWGSPCEPCPMIASSEFQMFYLFH